MPELVTIDNEGIDDPRVNLAIEEYALREFDPRYTYLLFYVNRPSIILGRNQNALEEINLRYVRERGIPVVRRLSGGGAVYHDKGNLCFSFITDYQQDRLHNFRLFTEPVVRVLQSLGVPAMLEGRNDLVVEGKKISGNAQFSTPRRMASHGTLLLNTDLTAISRALIAKPDAAHRAKYASVRARVANIADYLTKDLDVARLRAVLLTGIFAGSGIRRYRLSARDWEGVQRTMARRYARPEWNYGESPRASVARSRRFGFGRIEAKLEVKGGRIEQARLFGDFLGTKDVRGIERALAGTWYEPEVLEKALSPLDWHATFPALSLPELLALLHPASDPEKTSTAA